MKRKMIAHRDAQFLFISLGTPFRYCASFLLSCFPALRLVGFGLLLHTRRKVGVWRQLRLKLSSVCVLQGHGYPRPHLTRCTAAGCDNVTTAVCATTSPLPHLSSPFHLSAFEITGGDMEISVARTVPRPQQWHGANSEIVTVSLLFPGFPPLL